MSHGFRTTASTRRVVLLLWLLATLVPALAQAATAWRNQAQPWGELCVTASASQAARDGSGHTSAGEHEHCDSCLTRLDPLAPPSAQPAGLAPLPLAQALPALYLHAPAPLFAWRSAQPRAPPAAG